MSKFAVAIFVLISALYVSSPGFASPAADRSYRDQNAKIVQNLRRFAEQTDREETLAGLRRGEEEHLFFTTESVFVSAAAYGFVDFLVELCVSQEISSAEKFNALEIAATMGTYDVALALLKECGVPADVRRGDEVGLWSPIAGVAADFGHVEVLNLLIKNGAVLTGGCNDVIPCFSPLVDAVMDNREDVLSILAQSGYELSDDEAQTVRLLVAGVAKRKCSN